MAGNEAQNQTAPGNGDESAKRMAKAEARNRQLQLEIATRRKESERIIAENLRQNEELHILNSSLEEKIKERTRQLEASNQTLEKKNQELESLTETKEAMMHMMVHDLKNPLTSILGTLALAQNPKLNLDPSLREVLQDGNQMAHKLLAMIEGILDISRMRSKEFKIQAAQTDLVRLMQQTVALMTAMADGKKIPLTFLPPAEPVMAMVDAALVERVLGNLISNGLKYAPQGSSLDLRLKIAEGEAVISVINWGVPIPAEYHEKIFELFARVDSQNKGIRGTGLGLAFCKLAAEAHQGKISVESPVSPHDHGAQFRLSLPLNPPAFA